MFKFDTTFAYHRLSHSGVGTRELDTLRVGIQKRETALAGARGGAGGFSCPHPSAHDQGRHPPSAVCQSDV